MKRILKRLVLVILTSVFIPLIVIGQTGIIDSMVIYDWQLKSNTIGNPNFNVGVDSQNNQHDWILDMGDNMEMAYKGMQDWGAVFITIGDAFEDSVRDLRISDDYSRFNYFYVDLKGKVGKELLEIALKDKFDPNNGNETKVPIEVTDKWVTYKIPLGDFRTADLERLHVVTIFLFRGIVPRTVYFKNIRFIKKNTVVIKD